MRKILGRRSDQARDFKGLEWWCHLFITHGDTGLVRNLELIRTALTDEVSKHLCHQ